MPLEDHVGPMELTLDLSVARAPPEAQVSELLARSGVAGGTAELTESGLQLVLALKSQESRLWRGLISFGKRGF